MGTRAVLPQRLRPLPEPDIQAFQDLYDRRGQLVKMLAAEKNHRHAAAASRIVSNIEDHIRYLEKQIKDLEDRMDAVIADLLDKGISEEELARAKRSAIAQAIYSLDNQATLANIVGQALAIGESLAEVQEWPARVQAVTLAQVQAAAQKYLRPEASATGYLEPRDASRS